MDDNSSKRSSSDDEKENDHDLRWKRLYRIGGTSALIIIGLWIIQGVIIIAMGPPPSTASGWFTHFEEYGLLGLLNSFLLDIVAVTLMIPVFLALYIALRRVADSLMAISGILVLMGITLSFATNVTLSMLYLSHQYAAATTEVQRSLYMAVGESILTNFNGTGSTIGYLFMSIAGLIISIVMLRSKSFSKATAYTGILANAIQLAEPPGAFVPASFYENMGIGFFLVAVSGVFFIPWYILSARALLRLGRLKEKPRPQSSE